ncbi:mechanosensitive ion channel family protein, partial [Rhodothermus sp. AH-315-K08]|nr:mechanosensitive ion channel family protein [Rhodothermus sp. AH-315-K08]
MVQIVRPLVAVGVFLLIGYFTGLLSLVRPETGTTLLFYLVQVGLWLSASWLIIALVNRLVWDGLVSAGLQRPVPRLLKDLGGLIVLSIAVVGIVGVVFERSVGALITTSGVVGIVLGLALQNMIQDLFMGVAMNIEGSLKIGDWVYLHGSIKPGITGYDSLGFLEEINWRTSRIRTRENTVVLVPNRMMGNMAITNLMSSPVVLRVSVTLDPSVPLDRAIRILMAAADVAIREKGFTDRAPVVRMKKLTREGASFEIECEYRAEVLPPPDALDLVNRRVHEFLDRAGLSGALLGRTYWGQDEIAPDLSSATVRYALLRGVAILRALTDQERQALAESMVQR